jgi:hypothetical protein
MADLSPVPDSNGDTVGPDRDSTAGTPRWVAVSSR